MREISMSKSFNFQKSPLVLAAAFCALSTNALAETYTVQVELNSTIGETPLVTEQTQAMSYPVLEVNEATKEGTICVASLEIFNDKGFDGETASNANSLCPNATALRAEIQFTGVPGAIITTHRSIPLQEQHGVRFAHRDGEALNLVYNLLLSADEGTGITAIASSITLIDKFQVTDAVMEFTYDISAAYQ